MRGGHLKVGQDAAQGFTTVSVNDRRIAEALPLIRTTWPGVGLDAWHSFVQSFKGKNAPAHSGVIALIDGSGGLCGVLAYRRELDLADGPILFVRLFSAIDLRNSSMPVRALLNAAIGQAQRHGCRSIHICLTPEQAQLEQRIRSLGVLHLGSVHRLSLDLAPALT